MEIIENYVSYVPMWFKTNQIKYENEKTTTLLPRRVGHLTRQLRNREK